MIDLPALKARLSDPREVARLLGLRVNGTSRGGVRVKCPLHSGDSLLSMGLICNGGTLQARCFAGCLGEGGDILKLLEAIEGDFKRGLARAVEIAGGAIGKPEQQFEEAERLASDVYHALAERILVAGRLDGRPGVRPVEDYLRGRGLLELARADGWAALPALPWLLDIARDVCQGASVAAALGDPSDGPTDRKTVEWRRARNDAREGLRSEASEKSEAFAFSPPEMLILAGLAQWGRDGRLRMKWGAHRLVIPWRGPDGRVSALQRRRVEDGDGAKYVFPWKPDWPYGSERLRHGTDSDESRGDVVGHVRGPSVAESGASREVSGPRLNRDGYGMARQPLRKALPHRDGNRILAICEGAVDTLALRALHPRIGVLGIPGIDGWRPEWAKLVGGRGIRITLDRGKERDGKIIPEDRAAARIALDCAGMGQRREDVIEWLTRRHRQGKALFCVLCGTDEPWLCGACGRRKSKAKDWAEEWAARRSL